MKRIFGITNTNIGENNFVTAQNARLDITGELEAITTYLNHYNETYDMTAKQTIMDIVSEEEIHIGQLFGLLFSLDPKAKEHFEKGYNEFISLNNSNK